MMTQSFIIPPFFIEVDGVFVQVIEVLKTSLVSGESYYHVVVSVNYKGIKSRRFTLDVRNEKELVNKLKVEIAKIKMIEYCYGLSEVRRLIS